MKSFSAWSRLAWPREHVNLVGVAIALLISSVVLLIYQALSLRASLTDDVSMQASVLAENLTASAMFGDREATAEILGSLRKVPHVESATVYTPDGELFVRYARPGLRRADYEEGTLENVGNSRRLSLEDIFVAAPIIHNDRLLGSIVVVAATDAIKMQLAQYGCFLIGASLCSVWIASLVMKRMRERVSRAEKDLEYLASTDPLTDLPNRRAFYDELKMRLHKASAANKRVALMMVDLDNFKTVNDTLGHGAGDELLKQVAEALRNVVRPHDLVSRIGGDEFAIVLGPDASRVRARATAGRVARNLSRPFVLHGIESAVSASVGFSVYPEDTAEIAELVSNADIALYSAKSRGKSIAVEFQSEMTAEAQRRARIEAELRKALEQDGLDIVYQPQFDCLSGRLLGAEALVRWTHPTEGPILPAEFVPIAENSDLIVALGRWVLWRACRDAANWNAGTNAGVHVAVNISARQLRTEGFTDEVCTALKKSGLPASLLELELTESQLMSNMSVGIQAMQELRAAGVRLSLDDFGTGYSSLSYLQSFPVHSIKIDRSFICPLPNGGQPIVTAIISMAHSFGLLVVAEGVEYPAQLEWLCDARCDVVQGFLTGRPMRLEQLLTIIRAEEEQKDTRSRTPVAPRPHRVPTA
ncbi:MULTISPECIES: putative bifunctional diguanylate cyclase/phosphodiesterase [Paraburkholderia]|uniref:Diguanylate cyclase (GGDEF)-like protein n=1 Tax=Paraburkholderia caledonica TaxID=134536 RepID=A0ABU1L4I7_9BURK|nr:EAL domain-containing protein [Paraburkholderia caledonica]MDR6378134.1 diguanylate cyclase (GGDEF)-like protein [Paraburkholderia caledonica]OWJ62241.1 GGDEF-domain containing protein [Burkholderia sp. Bk]TCG01376.1 GGDEF-domain containing protein [Paraburkholderia strydomiana]